MTIVNFTKLDKSQAKFTNAKSLYQVANSSHVASNYARVVGVPLNDPAYPGMLVPTAMTSWTVQTV